MQKIYAFLLIWVWASSSFASPEDDAIYFVEKMGVGKNFPQMVLAVASKMQTAKMITNELGISDGRALIKENVAKATEKYQNDWNRNLALSYLEFFSGEELREVADKKIKSKAFKEIEKRQREIGLSMQKKSMKLLQETAAEAMTNAFTAITTSNK